MDLFSAFETTNNVYIWSKLTKSDQLKQHYDI